MKLAPLACLLLVSATLAAVRPGWAAPKVFHDAGLGYSITYDDTCKLVMNTNRSQDHSEWWMESAVNDKATHWTLSLTVDPLTTNPDTRLEAQEMAASLKRDVPGLKIMHDPTLFPFLLDAWTFDWVAHKDKATVHGAQYLDLSPRQQRLYVFTASAPNAMFATWKGEWERVLATFKFD